MVMIDRFLNGQWVEDTDHYPDAKTLRGIEKCVWHPRNSLIREPVLNLIRVSCGVCGAFFGYEER